MNKLFVSNALLVIIIFILIGFIFYLKQEGTKCAMSPCNYILEKAGKDSVTCGLPAWKAELQTQTLNFNAMEIER